MIIAAICAAAIEIARIVTKGRFPLSAVSIGLGVVLPPEYASRCGSARMVFWCWDASTRRRARKATGSGSRAAEPICAGLISAAALMGICDAMINVFLA